MDQGQQPASAGSAAVPLVMPLTSPAAPQQQPLTMPLVMPMPAAQAQPVPLLSSQPSVYPPQEQQAVVKSNPMYAMQAKPSSASSASSGGTGAGILDRIKAGAAIVNADDYIPLQRADELPNITMEYALFLEPADLTTLPRNPKCCGFSFCGKCCLCMMNLVGVYDWNRLKYWKQDVLPKMDGPVHILQLSSMAADNTFLKLNDADKNAPLPREHARVSGVIRKNLLYKKLPKENIYIPAGDWAEEMERSEISEILLAMQMLGAIAVDYEHTQSLDQPVDPESVRPPATNPLAAAANAFAGMGRFFSRAKKLNVNVAVPGFKGSLFKDDALSGRVFFRLNARPPETMEECLAQMGKDFFHLKTQPSIMTRMKLRMARGILVMDYFTLTHYVPDSTCLEGMRLLQVANLPNEWELTRADRIDTGYRQNAARPRFETRFKIIYPDMKEAAEGRQAGYDLSREASPLFAAGGVHPLSSVKSWDEVGRAATVDVATQKAADAEKKVQSEEDKVKAKDTDAATKEAVLAVKKELVATRRKLYETSADAYLARSMLDFTLTMKDLPAAPRSDGFHLPEDGSVKKVSVGGAVQGKLGAVLPFGLLGSLLGGKKKTAAAPAAGGRKSLIGLPSSNEVVVVTTEEEDAVQEAVESIPPPIDPSRPSMATTSSASAEHAQAARPSPPASMVQQKIAALTSGAGVSNRSLQ